MSSPVQAIIPDKRHIIESEIFFVNGLKEGKCWLFWEISKRGFDEGICPASESRYEPIIAQLIIISINFLSFFLFPD